MNLQIASRLAIFAVLELAANPERQLSVGEIGEKYGVSSHHLAKVIGRAGLVRSVRGAGGGYQFVGNTRRTTLLDIIQLFENFGTRDDDGAPGANTSEGATLREVLGEIDDIARATLGSITIATLLSLVARQHRQPKPAEEPRELSKA